MQIPPWLDVSPSQFVQAREAGVRAGQENAQLGQQGDLERARLAQERDLEGARISQQGQMEGARLAQSAAEAAQQLGLAKQRLEAQQKQTAMEFQAGQETAKQNFMLRQTQDAVANAYKQAQIGLGQQRIDQTAKKVQQDTAEKAQALADRQNYSMAVAGGMTPAEALAKYPRAWTPALAQATARPGPEKTVTERFEKADEIPAVPGSPAYSRSLLNPKSWFGDKNVAAVPDVPAVPAHPAYSVTQKIPIRASLADAFHAAAPGAPAPTPAAGGPAPAAPSSPGLPKQGDVINGYVFKGGDPADQKNWMEAPSQPSPVQ
jgi:hypothetical protein